MLLRKLDERFFPGSRRLAASRGNGGNGGRDSVLQNLPAGAARKSETPRRILVVEDNLDGVHSLVLLLRDMGHTVEYAINGYAALDLAKRFRPEFVLLDLNLPDLSGLEVCRRIKRDAALAGTRVVALTAMPQQEYRQAALSAGCSAYFLKPIDPRALEKLFSEE